MSLEPPIIERRDILLSMLQTTKLITVMILNFWTDRSGQTVQTQIRLLLEEQSDLGLHYLLFHLHLLETFLYCKANLLKF